MRPFAENFKETMADADESQPLVCDNGTGMVKVRSFKTSTSCILYFKQFIEGKGRPLVSQIFFLAHGRVFQNFLFVHFIKGKGREGKGVK